MRLDSFQLMSPRAAHLLGRHILRVPDRRPKQAELDLHRTKGILVVRLDKIGDVILTIPLLRELRRNAPKAWITLVVNPGTRELVEHCPYFNEVLTFEGRLRTLAALRRRARAVLFARRHLCRRFDLAVVPRLGTDAYDATFLVYFSGAPYRVAYSEFLSEDKAHRNRDYDLLLTQTLRGSGPKHQVESNLDVLLQLGGIVQDSRLELFLTQDDRAFARQALAGHGARDDESLVAFAPGAGAKQRCWPLQRWIDLGAQLRRELAFRLVLIGNELDSELGTSMERALGNGVINLVGQTTLRQTGAILERCALTVSNDSGPMHIAAAAGSSVVEISCHPRGGDPNGVTSPIHFHPWGVPHIVLQAAPTSPSCRNSCNSRTPHCILGIDAESVQQAVRKLLAQTGAAKPEKTVAATTR